MNELKPCAHCGGEARAVEYRDAFDDLYSVVYCLKCDIRTLSVIGSKLPELIEIWNKRCDK